MSINIFLKFEDPGIDGASTAPGHQGEIEVLSWNHGFAQPSGAMRSAANAGRAGRAGSTTTEQANHQSFAFTKYLDHATNDLLRYCWSGKQIGKAVVTHIRGDAPYLIITMEHVMIANYAISGGPGEAPVENISLDYGIIQYRYIPSLQTGGVPVTHNLESGTIT